MNPVKGYIRNDGRSAMQMRPVVLLHDQFGYADASVLLAIGNTKVLASVTLQDGVPPFLRNKGQGWLTAEYAMLPTATHVRTNREFDAARRNGRSVEISRLIGRCFRTVVDVSKLGERTIVIDCDVLQADGGTRAACITAASHALQRGLAVWKQQGKIPASYTVAPIAALSGGMLSSNLVVDLSYEEDQRAEADATFVLRSDGAVIEVACSAERVPLRWAQISALQEAVAIELQQLFT